MQYAYCSMRDVIGRVIRNTRITDPSYIADIHEWIYEAMEMLETEQTLKGGSSVLQVKFHKAKLPCGIREIDFVVYNGHRLREGRNQAFLDNGIANHDETNGPQVFQSLVDKIQPVENHLLYTAEIKAIADCPVHKEEYYFIDMGVLNTSFEDGEVKIYHQTVPVDSDNMPLIPDTQNYKQALYWYCRAMLIGAGYNDKLFTHQQCLEYFEVIYAPRALAEIRMPSPEQMERRRSTFVRLMPNEGYYDSFFNS